MSHRSEEKLTIRDTDISGTSDRLTARGASIKMSSNVSRNDTIPFDS